MSEKQNEAWWLAQDLILLTQEGQFTGSTTEKLLRQCPCWLYFITKRHLLKHFCLFLTQHAESTPISHWSELFNYCYYIVFNHFKLWVTSNGFNGG